MMLDLVGYTVSEDLGAETIVEPGCGDGSFLRQIIPRLITSARENERDVRTLSNAIRAYELDASVAELARADAVRTLASLDVNVADATSLVEGWIIQGDFLLVRVDTKAKWVVGNPPYVRIEESSPAVYAKYRRRWATMSGRADVYIGFYEAGLSLLNDGGRLCFICADRWMHNQYGARLRKHIIEDFSIRAVLELHDSDVFDVPVAAYPAVVLIERSPHTVISLATGNSRFDESGAARLMEWWRSTERADAADECFGASILKGNFRSDASWPSGPPERLRMIAELESRLPSLAEVGIYVGVGLATGADRVYVVTDPGAVEKQFVKEAVGPADLKNGLVEWTGRYVISPWDGTKPADLEAFPGLRQHLKKHREILEARYVGKRNPNVWWRTIDRPPTHEYRADKIIVADLNDRIDPVLDTAGRWPLHGAYYMTSSEWDLKALGGYLLSDVAAAFVEAYSVRMANGHLRISSQYLKKIRIPRFAEVPSHHRDELRRAFQTRDRVLASAAARRLIAVTSAVA